MNELVEAMLAAVPADGSSIGNQWLLEHLKIQFPHLRDEFYWQTREALIDQGLLRAGKGRGGSVRRSDVELPPASAWVQFLRSYGPSSRNLAMFDEYVTRALAQAGVEPISLSTPLLEDMVRHIESKAPGSILIAGTAGDGKTYHCRSLWERIGGDPKAWAAKGNVKELPLADGRLAVFIKDLSEFNGEESDLPLLRLEKSVLQGNDSEIVILAANHGQILDRLRDLGRRQERDQRHRRRSRRLRAAVADAHLDPGRQCWWSRRTGRAAADHQPASPTKLERRRASRNLQLTEERPWNCATFAVSSPLQKNCILPAPPRACISSSRPCRGSSRNWSTAWACSCSNAPRGARA